jgi:hypothetical protein
VRMKEYSRGGKVQEYLMRMKEYSKGRKAKK